MKKAKAKARTKTKKRGLSFRHQSFTGANSVKMLALALMVIIFADGVIFGLVSAGDINVGLEVLDVSAAVQQTTVDVTAVLQPMIDVATSVDKFYNLAASETMFLLEDNIVTNIGTLFTDINNFYRMASNEMAAALDISDQLYPNVAYAAY